MEAFNFIMTLLGGIVSLTSIIDFIKRTKIVEESPQKTRAINKKKIADVSFFILGLSLVVFIPLFTSERIISTDYGPYFLCRQPDSSKFGLKVITDVDKPFLSDTLSLSSSSIKVVAKGVLCSGKPGEKANLRLLFSDSTGYSRAATLHFSKRVSLTNNNEQDYRNAAIMETQESTIEYRCNSPVEKIAFLSDPGSYALSIQSVTIIGISKVNVLEYIKRRFFQ